MHYLVYVSTDGLYVNWLGSRQAPVAVVRDHVVIDCCSASAALGVHQGMPKGVAKSIGHGVEFVEWNPDNDAALAASWLNPLLEVSDGIECVLPHYAFIDISAHRDPPSLLSRISGLLPDQARVGMGCSKWLAIASARSGSLSADFVAKPANAIRNLPVDYLPIDEDTVRRLVFLGYRTIHSLQGIDLDTLKQQFGAEGVTIYQSVRGGTVQLVQPNFPRGEIRVRMQPRATWDDQITRSGDLHRLATRLAKPLIDQDLVARMLAVTIEQVDGHRDTHERTFSKPMRTAQQILLGLESLCRSSCGDVTDVRVCMSGLEEPVIRQYPLEKFGSGQPGQTLIDAVSAVRTVYGQSAIQRGSEVPVPRRRQVMKSWQDATGWR